MDLRTGKLARSLRFVTPACFGLFAIGCGGGGGSAGNATGPGQSTQLGPVAVTFTGHPQAAINGSSGQVTSVGQAGATYTSLSMNPAPNLNSTFLAFTRTVAAGDTGDQIYTLPFGSGAAVPLVHTSVSGYPTISQSGVIAFVMDLAGTDSIMTIKSDGSGQKLVSSLGFVEPSISPNGSLIAFVAGGNIYTIPAGGGSTTLIYTGSTNAANGVSVVWSPSGSQIAFTATNSVTSTPNAYVMNSNGSSVGNITPNPTGTTIPTAWSPDGTTIACTFTASSASTSSIEYIGVTGNSDNNITVPGFSDSSACFSPDNQKVAFYRTNAGGATPGIYMCDYQGTNLQLVLADPTTVEAKGRYSPLFGPTF